MNARQQAAIAAHDRKQTAAHQRHHVLGRAGARAIKQAVAEDDTFNLSAPARVQHLIFHRFHGVDSRPDIRRSVLADTLKQTERSGHDAPGTCGRGGGNEVARSFDPEPIGGLEIPGPAHSGLRQRRQLMDDVSRPRRQHGARERFCVERIGNGRLCAEPAKHSDLALRTGESSNVMARGNQLPHERDTNRPGRPGQKDSHDSSIHGPTSGNEPR